MGKAIVTSIRIDEDVFREAKELGLNVSKITENALKEAIRKLKSSDCPNDVDSSVNASSEEGLWRARRDLDPRPSG